VNPQAVAPAQDSDSLLVERAQAGDQKAYSLLVLKYQRRIQRLIGRMAVSYTHLTLPTKP
jgi:RNA polymerase sigma-70 factor (ECF subfamily)